ncbi:uncharacterized protein [Lolium perenne]|uniref:uncharacterized protein n=1 Tax=Lolium perenne TaxID=4522 RepID=UPI003A99DF33
MEVEPLNRVHAGESPLREPIHDADGEVAAFSVGNAAANVSAEEATLRQRRASQDAAPFHRADYLIPIPADAPAPAPGDHDEALPRSRAHLAAEEEREGATLRQRRAARPTTPSSPRRPRRRRGSTSRRGCGAPRSSTPTGRASLDGPEPEAGGTASPLPCNGRSPGMRVGEDDLRGSCCVCVGRRLPGDVCVGDGVNDLEGALLQRAGDVRSAEADAGRGDGAEDRAGRRLIGTQAEGCVVVGAGDAKMAATDVFMACASCDGCGAPPRSSTPAGRASLDGPEAGATASPLPCNGRSPGMRVGEDDLRGSCCVCVGRRLPGDVCVGDGVKDLEGALLQHAGGVRSSEADAGAEDRAGRRLIGIQGMCRLNSVVLLHSNFDGWKDWLKLVALGLKLLALHGIYS